MASALRFERLSCGIPACIQTASEARLISLSVWINAGSSQDPAGKAGLAHLCEHLLLRPLMCAGSRAQRIQLKTGALLNARTDPDWVVILAQAPGEQSRSLIDLLLALLRDPYSSPDGLEAEKKVILRELRDRASDSAGLLAQIFRESAFVGSPCVHPVGAIPATLDAIQPEDVQRYFDRSLIAPRMLITAHGNTGVRDLTALLDDAFGDFSKACLPAGFRTGKPAMKVRPAPLYRPVRIFKETSNMGPMSGYGLLAGLASVPRGTEAYWTALAFEVLMADGPGSLLSQWLRSGPRPLYGAVSMTEAFADWGCQYFLMRIAENQVEAVTHQLGRQWLALSEAVTDERVEMLRNRFATRALSSLAHMQDRMTLMRDIALEEPTASEKLERSLEAIVSHNVEKLNSGALRSYIRQYAEWDRVSLVCAPL